MKCLFSSSCCIGPHSRVWIRAAHTKPRAAIAIMVSLPESVVLKVPWVQAVTTCFPVQMAAGEGNGSFKSNLTHWFDVLGQAVRSGKTGLSPHQKWVRAGSASAESHQAASSLLPPAIWVRPWPVSSCFHLVETKLKEWRSGGHLAHFSAELPVWWGHVARVHHFIWSFCLPGFILSNTMVWGLSALPQVQPALPCR